MADESASWWALIVAATPGGGAAAIALYRWWGERRDKRDERAETAEERRDALRLQEAKAEREASAEMRDRLLSENRRLAAELGAETTRADMLEQRVRDWHGLAHNMRHAAQNARTAAAGLASRTKVPLPPWSEPLDLPPLIAPATPPRPPTP